MERVIINMSLMQRNFNLVKNHNFVKMYYGEG